MAVIDVYDATVDDVDRLLIWDVRSSERPKPAMVEAWIEEGALELQGTVGDIPTGDDPPCGGDAVRARARRIVALYAASMAEDAHYPERTMDRKAGDYGARLYARWEKLAAGLIADIERCRDGVNASGPSGGSVHSFPSPPFFAREMGT